MLILISFLFFFSFFFGFELGDWLKFLRNCQIEREEQGEMKWRINEKKVADWILVRSCICELIRNIVKYILNHFLFFIRKTNFTKGYDYFREFIKVDNNSMNLYNICCCFFLLVLHLGVLESYIYIVSYPLAN